MTPVSVGLRLCACPGFAQFDQITEDKIRLNGALFQHGRRRDAGQHQRTGKPRSAGASDVGVESVADGQRARSVRPQNLDSSADAATTSTPM